MHVFYHDFMHQKLAKPGFFAMVPGETPKARLEMAIDPIDGDRLQISETTEPPQATREERLERLRKRLDALPIGELNMTGAQFRVYCKLMLAPNTATSTMLALTEDEITVLEKVLTVRDFFATHICSLPAIPRF